MTHVWWLSVALLLTLHEVSLAEERQYKGEVLLDDPRTGPPAQFIEVRIREVGHPNLTNEKGHFEAFLPPRLKPGKDITIEVRKEGYIIQAPIDGVATIPENLDRRNKILLFKQGLPALLTDERKDKILKDSQDRSRAQVKPDKDNMGVDLNVSLQEEARRLGLPPQDLERAVKERGKENRKSTDPHRRGLAATADNNPAKAAEYFEQAADQKIQQLERLRSADTAKPFLQSLSSAQQIVKKTESSYYEDNKLINEIVTEFRLAGHAYYNSYAFEKAVQAYQRAEQFLSKEESTYEWAAVQSDLGLANWAFGIQTKGPRIHQHLKAAVAAYRAALTVYTKERFPQEWALTQPRLGSVLRDQGIRTSGEDGNRLLAEAVAAHRAALTVFTKAQSPQEWAFTQTTLGYAFSEQGIRTGGDDGTRLLTEAVDAHRAALTVYTKERFPQEWAFTQIKLGSVLREQGIRTGGDNSTRLLTEAVTAHRAALTVFTKAQSPQAWAHTQGSLGIILMNQGSRTGGEDSTRLLAEAVTAHRAALTVYTKERLPQDWALTQNNLGSALGLMAMRSDEDATRLLAEAVTAHRSALTVLTEAQLPEYWAGTQNNLGNKLSAQGLRTGGEDGTRLLTEAVDAHRAALTVFTREDMPGLWAISRPGLTEDFLFLKQWSEVIDDVARLRVESVFDMAVALDTLEIIALIGQGETSKVPQRLTSLKKDLALPSSEHSIVYDYENIKQFIKIDKHLEDNRDWLFALIEAVERKDRVSRLTALDKVQAKFRTTK
jgi:tetratricopeptide (TPR) repeat protein